MAQHLVDSVFSNRSFRLMWTGNMLVHFSSWLFLVGAAWLMTGLNTDPFMVALVQSASALASLVLSLPAGVLADTGERRRVMMSLQLASCAACIVITVSLSAEALTAPLLLLLTFVTQASLATYLPLANATFVDAVRTDQVEESMAQASLAFNLARCVGPGLAGLGLVYAGAPILYALIAFAFALACGLIYHLPRERPRNAASREPLTQALLAVFLYAHRTRQAQALLVRGALIGFSGSAVWALLPIVARSFEAASASTFGTLVGILGLGAVIGALQLKRLRRLASAEVVINAFTGVFAIVTIGIAFSGSLVLTCVLLLLGGGAWMLSTTVLFAVGQSTVAVWVRARFYALLLVAFQTGFATGAALWGMVARHAGVQLALTIAAASVLLVYLSVRCLPISSDTAPAAVA